MLSVPSKSEMTASARDLKSQQRPRMEHQNPGLDELATASSGYSRA